VIEFPDGWTKSTLGDVRVDRSSRVIPAEAPDEVFELFSIPSFPSGTAQILRGAEIGSDKQSVDPGTVLVSKINPRINRVWVVRPRTSHRAIASTEWVTFAPTEGVVPEFLAYYLRRDVFREYLATNASGVGGSLMRVRPALIDRYPFLVAPIAEQHRIVAALDEYLSELDAAAAALERANLVRYSAGVIAAGVSGGLTGRTTWPVVRLGDVFDVSVGATPSRARAEYWNGDIPWVSSGEVAFNRIRKTRETITDAGLRHSSTKLCAPGTVLIGMIGEGRTRGQVAILEITACTNQNAAAIHVARSEHIPEFVYFALASQYEATRRIGSGNNQKALNKSRVQDLTLVLPPPDEQSAAVAEIESRLAVADHTAAETRIQLARAMRLRQAILTHAFAGKLVPRD
jgi:type I restriction enzyme S subunit